MTATDGAYHLVPTLRQRFWRKLGFRYHLGEEPEGTETMIGWMRTDCRIHFGWADRLRLLVSGTLKFSTIVHHDTPSASVCKTRLDWQIVAPGDRS